MSGCMCRRAFGNHHKDDCPESEIYKLRAEVSLWKAFASPYTPQGIGELLATLNRKDPVIEVAELMVDGKVVTKQTMTYPWVILMSVGGSDLEMYGPFDGSILAHELFDEWRERSDVTRIVLLGPVNDSERG